MQARLLIAIIPHPLKYQPYPLINKISQYWKPIHSIQVNQIIYLTLE